MERGIESMVETLLKHLRPHRWLALALLFALVAGLDYGVAGFSRIIDQRLGDRLLALHAQGRPASDHVVIIDIDQRSLEQMNDLAGSWPWPRSVHGELIDHLARQNPRAIAFDILFNEADIYRPEHDAAFTDAVARNPNVWLAMTLNADGTGAPMAALPPSVGVKPLTNPPNAARVPLLLPLVVASQPAAMRGGLINFTPDSDGVGRHHWLWRDRSGWRFPSMPARVLESVNHVLPGPQKVMLNWRKGWQHISYVDLYLDSQREHPIRPADEFKGKIVVIGTAAPGLQDLRVTPLATTYPGVEVLATAFDNLDRGDWLREVPRSWALLLALGLIGLVALGFRRGIVANRLGYAMIGITLLVLIGQYVLLGVGWYVPLAGALCFGWLFYLTCSALAYVEERAERLRTFGMFKRFLDPTVVTQLIAAGEIDHRNSATTQDITVLFSDIRGFTSLSENAPPEQVVSLLNIYFQRQVDIIFAHGGTLDKFIGDGLMAFWGAPIAQPDHARRAVSAALEMAATIEGLREQLGDLGAGLDIGIGVHSGLAVVGFIGASDRLDYTAIGDTVNSAARIESQTKGVARVLVSDATRIAVGDSFAWQDKGAHQVKGREAAIRLFEPSQKTDIIDHSGSQTD